MLVLGCSAVLLASKSRAAILADLAIRGIAISFSTLARVASVASVVAFLCSTQV
jgi:hypothetical protein